MSRAAAATRESAPAECRLVLAGVPQVAVGARQRALETGDALLLAWLAIEGPTSRARLCSLLFPGVNDATARNSLRQRLFKLKKKLTANLIAGDAVLQIASDVAIELDGDGELLAGADPADLEEMGEWLIAQRDKRRVTRTGGLAAAAEQAEAAGELAAALEHASQLVQLQPESEHAHRRVMRLHYLRGDRAAALAAYESCRAALQRSLGAAPSLETEQLLATIRAAQAVAIPAARNVPPVLSRPPRLIGRETELQHLQVSWAEGSAFSLIGEAGMGKTRMLTELAGVRADLAYVQARPGDSTVAFASLARLMLELRARLPPNIGTDDWRVIARVVPDILSIDDDSAPIDRRRLHNSVVRLFALAQDRGIGGFLFDDLHFADDASVEALGIVLSAPGLATLQIGLAWRPGETGHALRGMQDLDCGARRVVSVPLGPLDVPQLAQLVDSLSIGLAGAKVAPMLARRTGGNPLFVLETLKSMKFDGAGGAVLVHSPGGNTVGALIERRLRQLSPPALALARVCAVAGVDFTTDLALHVLQVRLVDLADPWAELESAQVLRGAAFAHDLVQDAALRTIPMPIAEQMHAAVGAFLEEHAGEPARIAQHWLRGRQGVRAVPHLEHAARDALVRLQRPLAATHLESAASALHESGDSDAAFDTLCELCKLLQDFDTGNRHDEATQRLLDRAQTDSQRARAGVLRATYLYIAGHAEKALAIAEHAHLSAEAAGEDAQIAEADDLAGLALRRLGRLPESRVRHERALSRAPADTAELPGYHSNLGLALYALDDQAAAIKHFDEAVRLNRVAMHKAQALNNLAASLDAMGQFEASLQTRQRALALLAAQEGAAVIKRTVQVSIGSVLRRLQRYKDAISMFEAIEADGEAGGQREDFIALERALIAIDLGSWSAADAALERMRAVRNQSADMVLAGVMARARYAVARNTSASQWLDAAERMLLDQTEHRFLRRLIVYRARSLPPREALPVLQARLQIEARANNASAAASFATLAATALLELESLDEARQQADLANEALALAYPLEMSPFEVRFVQWRVLRAMRADGHEQLIASLARDLLDTAKKHVPEQHQNGFLKGVTLNRRILQGAEPGPRWLA